MMQAVRTTPLALQALLGHALDYAGLFPPASLSLEETVINYAKYRKMPEAWMLGRFICPVARISELIKLVSKSPPSPPWQISALGTGGNDGETFLESLTHDLTTLDAAAGSIDSSIFVTSLEVRWPASASNVQQTSYKDLLSRTADTFKTKPSDVAEVFFELPDYSSDSMYRVLLPLIRQHNDEHTKAGIPVFGAKIRCGGVEPAAFPSPEALANFISACTRAGVPFKATAGLHHPLYHFNTGQGVYMHGFLNVFFASVLMGEGLLDEEAAFELLTDGIASHFEINTEGLAWKGHAAPYDAIVRERGRSITSFGSCSFEEPLEDLQGMGLL